MEMKFEELTKYLSEFFYYLVSVILEGSKEKGWKSKLFIWPFLLGGITMVVLIVRSFMV